tara:strand:+ start:106 stop:747 length:642 start_codon:yes stop_codon:yes gene_type:complete
MPVIVSSSAGGQTIISGSSIEASSSSGLGNFFSGAVGINSAATVSLNVHYTGSGNPINLNDDTGGGMVVYFGSASANLSVGALYYLNDNGGWRSANASSTSSATNPYRGHGDSQLLGISLGTDPKANGMLVKGYFHLDSYFSGSFVMGGPMFIQSSSVNRTDTEGGFLSGASCVEQENAGEECFGRHVGYGTDTANVIYFNPEGSHDTVQQEE